MGHNYGNNTRNSSYNNFIPNGSMPRQNPNQLSNGLNSNGLNGRIEHISKRRGILDSIFSHISIAMKNIKSDLTNSRVPQKRVFNATPNRYGAPRGNHDGRASESYIKAKKIENRNKTIKRIIIESIGIIGTICLVKKIIKNRRKK